MQRTLSLICLALLLLAAGCRRDAPTVAKTAPPTPEAWEGIDPLVRAQIQECLAAVESAPGDGDAWAALAMAYHANDLIDLAAPCYRRAVKLRPEAPRLLFYMGRVKSELGDVPAALTAVTRAAELEDRWFLHWRRGFWLLDQGRLPEAREAFDLAVAMEPRDPTPQVGLARVALQKGELDKASSILRRLVAENPGMPNAGYVRHLLGTTFQQMGLEEEAQPLLAATPARSLSWPDPWSDELFAQHRRKSEWIIVQANRMIQAGEPMSAISHLRPLMEAQGDDPTLLKMMGMAYFALGDLDKAIASMTKVVEQDPDDFAAAMNLAHVLERAGRWDEAAASAAAATRLRPDSPEAALQEARVLIAGDRPQDAAVALERFSKIDRPPISSIYVWLAIARAEAGDPDGAKQALDVAMQINPGDPDLATAAERLRAAAGEGGR